MNNTKNLIITSLAVALVYIFTALINIRLPLLAQGGLIHLGNVPLFIFAILGGRNIGATCGAFGMALFDLLSGWTVWAPFTFTIVGAMGYVVGYISEKHHDIKWYSFALFLALIIKLVGYYIAEGLIYSNWVAPLASIPGNICQIVAAVVVALPLAIALKKRIPYMTLTSFFNFKT